MATAVAPHVYLGESDQPLKYGAHERGMRNAQRALLATAAAAEAIRVACAAMRQHDVTQYVPVCARRVVILCRISTQSGCYDD